MIYIKKIINNDIARTPTFNKESILEFFKINLTNGESTVLDIRLLPNNIDYSIKFQKRNTRDEYRIFLNDLFTTINPKEEDILIFRRTRKLYTCEHISQISESYKHLDNLFESESNHEVIIEESSDNPIENINYNFLNEFSDWLIQNEGSKHNYFKDSFSSKRENLIEGLLKYEDVYENQFGEKTFSFPKSELKDNILKLEKNLYLESGDFFNFSSKISNHLPRAILGNKNYLYFLKNHVSTKLKIKPIEFDINQFESNTNDAGLKYSNALITRYISSLATKPFVLLSGLSGSGKTKLAQSFAQWICEDDTQYKVVPVGADWTNREPLLGYVNALDNKEYVLPENGALQLLIEANKEDNQSKPYFLILDEMNLSHVERYFADFLSVMESKDKFKLHSSKSNLNITDGDKGAASIEVPSTLNWPKNLFVVGTVNIDETTYMFSPKVLDRANAIEFKVSETEIKEFLDTPNEIDLTQLEFKGANTAASFIEIAKNKEFETIDTDSLNKTLVNFFAELKKTGAEFGYRTGMEIHRLYQQLSVINKKVSENDKIDIAVMQKLLPKLHGSRRKLYPILITLAKLCVSEGDVKKDFLENKDELVFKENTTVIYPLSLEKITRMYKGAIDNGFASYAEA
jgi:5-methylcytosine-specific restriction protein B